jgi:glycosyltransferase involved in cell wall biosynthesis
VADESLVDEPLVTVVSPLYNGERYARIILDCMLAQTFRNWRYVIVDNHSSDATSAIAQEYVERDERIRLIRNPETYGVIRNHNEGFRQVDPASSYFRFLQADDVLMPDCLQRSVALAEQYPTTGIIGSWLQWGGEITSNQFPEGVGLFDGREVARRTLAGEVYPFLSPSGLLGHRSLMNVTCIRM